MAHVVADRVKETTTTTGTGAVTLAGAVTGFLAFSAVMANGDTAFYAIAGGAEWEVGVGTWNTGGTLSRTTVIASSNAGAAVNLSSGSKDVFITSPAVSQGWGALTVTPSANQDNYSPTGINYASTLLVNASASVKLTGLASGVAGRRVTIVNASTDYLLWLENENTASSAANRFSLPKGFPAFLMPGDVITLLYDATASRWRVAEWPNQGPAMGLTEFCDFAGSTLGPFTSTVSGTGASSQVGTYGVDTTEKAVGVVQIDTGTTGTGRATIGHAGTAAIVPTLGAALSVARLAQEQAESGSQFYQLISGFCDSAGGTITDGVAWELRWTGAAEEWSQSRFSNTTATRSTTGSPTPSTTYIWVVVFVNPGWTRADFIYSTDSVSFTKADSPTTGLPGSTRPTAWVGASFIKVSGTTQSNADVDLAGYRIDSVRG